MAAELVKWVEPQPHSAPPPGGLRVSFAVEDSPELVPLPPDPLGGASTAEEVEPPWLGDWLEEQGESLDGETGPDHLASEMLAAAEPGLFLAAELEGTAPRDVDEYHLVELIAGYHRMAAWAHARMTQIAADLSRRPALNPGGSLPTGEYVMKVAGDELAPRLGLSRFAAKRIVENGRLFGLKLEDTGLALEQGLIDYPKACTIARLLKDLDDDVAWEVQQIVLPEATHQTITQLEKAISKAIISVDPLRATARHKRAREQRRVNHPRPLPDGMASMFAVLPATDAAGLDLALEAAARAAKAAGDTRTIDQLRADALALLGHGALERGFIGCPDTPQHGTGDDVAADHSSAEDGPGEPVATSDERAPDSEPAAGDDDEISEALSGDGRPVLHTGNSFLRTPCMPLGLIGGRKARINVTVPLSVLFPFESLDEDRRCGGDSPAQDRPGTPSLPPDGSTADGCDRPCPSPPGREPEPGDGYPQGWYYGQPVEVAELDGYGPITPDVARGLAHSGGTWRRLVTDPLSGELLDVGRTRYRPPAPIADFVRLRDGSCVRPGCSCPAQAAQLDHVVPWEFGGVTSADNLAPLCTSDHPTKTIGAFQLRHLAGGNFEWTTPTGHRYVRHHSGRITALGRRRIADDGRRVAAFGDEPSF